jgi:uncharacterized protein (DUF697 family)
MSWMESLNAATKGPKKNLSEDERKKIAGDLVTMSSMGAAAITYAPIPLTDFVLVTPVQASMVMAIGRVYGRELNFEESKHILIELASVCGLGLLAQKGFATLSKILLPGIGGLLAGPYAFAVTYGMGHVAMKYFRDKDASREALKRVFDDAMAEGKKVFSREKLDEFRKNRGKDVSDFVNKVRGKEAGGAEEADPPKAKPKKKKKKARSGASSVE